MEIKNYRHRYIIRFIELLFVSIICICKPAEGRPGSWRARARSTPLRHRHDTPTVRRSWMIETAVFDIEFTRTNCINFIIVFDFRLRFDRVFTLLYCFGSSSRFGGSSFEQTTDDRAGSMHAGGGCMGNIESNR